MPHQTLRASPKLPHGPVARFIASSNILPGGPDPLESSRLTFARFNTLLFFSTDGEASLPGPGSSAMSHNSSYSMAHTFMRSLAGVWRRALVSRDLRCVIVLGEPVGVLAHLRRRGIRCLSRSTTAHTRQQISASGRGPGRCRRPSCMGSIYSSWPIREAMSGDLDAVAICHSSSGLLISQMSESQLLQLTSADLVDRGASMILSAAAGEGAGRCGSC